MSKPFSGYHQYTKKQWIKNKLKPSEQTINTSQSVFDCPGDMAVTPVSIRSRYRNYPSTLREYWLIRIIFITWLHDVVEGNSVREITWLLWRHRFSKSSVFKISCVHTKTHSQGFLRFEKRFRKAPFSWRISLDGRSSRKNKAAVSNSFGIVWTLR